MASQSVSSPDSRARPPSELTLKVKGLLSRYPNLSEDELATLIELYPSVPLVDIALLTFDDDLSDRFDAFHREHVAKMPPTLASVAAFLWFPALLIIGLLWWALN